MAEARVPLVPFLKVAARIPEFAWQPLAVIGARVAVWRQIKAVRQWSANVTVVTGRWPSKQTQRAAIRSWLRNTMGSIQLGRLSQADVLAKVVVDPVDLQRYQDSFAGPGAVLALPHMGDWDLAGAWSCAMGMPISSVAERLPDEEFNYFMGVRNGVGMTIYAHSDRTALSKLRSDLDNGRVVALLADRDMSRKGVPVDWTTATGSVPVTMPAGPAHLAVSTAARLIPTISTFEGNRMRLRFEAPIEPAEGPDAVAVMTQRLADVLSAHVRTKPIDWHVMQRFFDGVTA